MIGVRESLLAVALLWPAAAAGQSLGKAVDVIPAAVAIGGERIELLSGADLYKGQKIQTAAGGQVQVLFNDHTKLVIGPGSTVVIAKYLMRGGRTVTNLTVNAVQGSFRFLTGNSAKEAYRINTPTGTMGVRGTGRAPATPARARGLSTAPSCRTSWRR